MNIRIGDRIRVHGMQFNIGKDRETLTGIVYGCESDEPGREIVLAGEDVSGYTMAVHVNSYVIGILGQVSYEELLTHKNRFVRELANE